LCLAGLDTAIAAFALGESGLADSAALTRSADWLLGKEVRRKGDWSVKRPKLEPSGWAFEFANEYYPDIDDTAMVLLTFQHARASDAAAQKRSVERAVKWLLGMQSRDGGWAAFDVDNNWTILNKVPFADHNAMLDPTCPDITGRVLDALSRYGYKHGHPAVDAAVRYLLKRQHGTAAGTDGGASTTCTGPSWRCAAWRRAGTPARARPYGAGGLASFGAERGRRVGRKLRRLSCPALRGG